MIKVARRMVSSLACLESKLDLNSTMMIPDRCSHVNNKWRTGQYSLFLLRIWGDSKLPWIKDR
jgi:hypothetical protein